MVSVSAKASRPTKRPGFTSFCPPPEDQRSILYRQSLYLKSRKRAKITNTARKLSKGNSQHARSGLILAKDTHIENGVHESQQTPGVS